MKCGEYKNQENCFKCQICEAIFCSQCPYKGYNNGTACPSCHELGGQNFKGKIEYNFTCMKCGQYKNQENCFHCEICDAVFCTQCPHNRYNNCAACPSCHELAGKNFKGKIL